MSTPLRIGLWTLALLPLGAAMLAHQRGPIPTLSVTPPALPALAFDQYLVDLGPIRPTAEVQANFVFRHRGKHPVEIVEVKPSCGCLRPKLSKQTYAPGDVDAMVLRVLPANESPGRHEYTVEIKYHDPEPREAHVTFRVTLPEKGINIKPPALGVYQFSDQPTKQSVLITDTRGASWQVQGISVSLPFVTATAGERVHAESGAWELPIEVTVAGNVPAGRHKGVISVFTDDSAYPEMKIPLLIQGRESFDESDTEQHSVP
ncbi:MAG: DUF1573 domain-containing protein [Planctomycetaceae bacterium]